MDLSVFRQTTFTLAEIRRKFGDFYWLDIFFVINTNFLYLIFMFSDIDSIETSVMIFLFTLSFSFLLHLF